jgi:hypothetical protein
MIQTSLAKRIALAAASGLVSCLLAATAGSAAEVKVLTSVALTSALNQIAPNFEQATGNKLNIGYSLIADIRKRILDGETTDEDLSDVRANWLDDAPVALTVGEDLRGTFGVGGNWVVPAYAATAPQDDPFHNQYKQREWFNQSWDDVLHRHLVHGRQSARNAQSAMPCPIPSSKREAQE